MINQGLERAGIGKKRKCFLEGERKKSRRSWEKNERFCGLIGRELYKYEV